jgi:hypothetical protein
MQSSHRCATRLRRVGTNIPTPRWATSSQKNNGGERRRSPFASVQSSPSHANLSRSALWSRARIRLKSHYWPVYWSFVNTHRTCARLLQRHRTYNGPGKAFVVQFQGARRRLLWTILRRSRRYNDCHEFHPYDKLPSYDHCGVPWNDRVAPASSTACRSRSILFFYADSRGARGHPFAGKSQWHPFFVRHPNIGNRVPFLDPATGNIWEYPMYTSTATVAAGVSSESFTLTPAFRPPTLMGTFNGLDSLCLHRLHNDLNDYCSRAGCTTGRFENTAPTDEHPAPRHGKRRRQSQPRQTAKDARTGALPVPTGLRWPISVNSDCGSQTPHEPS